MFGKSNNNKGTFVFLLIMQLRLKQRKKNLKHLTLITADFL